MYKTFLVFQLLHSEKLPLSDSITFSLFFTIIFTKIFLFLIEVVLRTSCGTVRSSNSRNRHCTTIH